MNEQPLAKMDHVYVYATPYREDGLRVAVGHWDPQPERVTGFMAGFVEASDAATFITAWVAGGGLRKYVILPSAWREMRAFDVSRVCFAG